MITCLMFKNMYNVSVNDSGKFNLIVPDEDGGTKVEKQATSEIPFVRYRFEKFGATELAYIKKMQGIFKHSAHLAEVSVSADDSGDNFEEVTGYIKELKESLEKVCVFVYLNVTDEWMTYASENKDGLPYGVEDFLYDLDDFGVDQFCLRDKTTAAGAIQMNDIRKRVADIVYGDTRRLNSIALCESPLSFNGDETACLTAVKARELMAIYCNDELEQPTPSANHQCMACCGCIKYIEITSDIEAAGTKAKVATKIKETKPKSAGRDKEGNASNGEEEGSEEKKKAKKGVVNIRSMFF